MFTKMVHYCVINSPQIFAMFNCSISFLSAALFTMFKGTMELFKCLKPQCSIKCFPYYQHIQMKQPHYFLVRFLLLLILAVFSKIQVTFHRITQLSPMKMKVRHGNYEAMLEG